MLSCQRHLFQLPDHEHYLNCAYMSPLLKSVEEAGMAGMLKKRNPTQISIADFFDEAVRVRQLFGQLVNAPAEQVALMPSVAYGIATVVKNLPARKNRKALVIADEFPSDYLGLQSWCAEHQCLLETIAPPDTSSAEKGNAWNTRILETIQANTGVVVMSHVHWTDGTLFNLEAIGQRCKEVGALLIIDGTQSVGALPMDVERYNIAALLVAGYKWLMGPYAIGLAFYSEEFNGGKPLEESWMNRTNAQDFRNLTKYGMEYLPGAARYQVGEYSNFILLPMLTAAMRQLLAWNPAEVQAYCRKLTRPLLAYLQENNFGLEEAAFRPEHLFGFRLAAGFQEEKLFRLMNERKIFVSVRGNSIRVAPHVYNREADIQAFLGALDAAKT